MTNIINLPSPTLSLQDSHTNIQVAIRVRPLTESDQTQPRMSHSSDSNVIKTNGNTITIVPHQKSFDFDHVFDTESAQDQVYTGVVSNLVDRVLDGYNVTILAYGQTSSGKTHTIMGSDGLDQEGIIPRAMSAFFDRLSSMAPQHSTCTNMDSGFPASPSSSCIVSPRSPISPTKLRPLSTMNTNSAIGNSNLASSSQRDSAPELLRRTLDKSPRNSVHVSFVEIYNEELVDLLNTSPSNERPPTAIREDAKGQILWTGVKEVCVSRPEEVLRCLQMGTDARVTGFTDMNTQSSRSHAIFTVTLKQEKWIPAALSSSKSSDISQRRELAPSPTSSVSSITGLGRQNTLKIKTRMGHFEQHQHQYTDGKRDDDGEWLVLHSKLHFVDLAGSERLKRTSAEGNRRKEGININAGLLALGNVISALASSDTTSLANNSNKKVAHVPYRDSKLTRLLQDSLGGNAITLMIACISPAERNLAETTNTIKYAHRARSIKNKAGRNEAEDWMTNDNPEFLRSLITQLKSHIKNQKSELLHHQPGTDSDTDTQLQQKKVLRQHLNEMEQLKRDIGSLTQVEIKQGQIIHILEQKLVGMAQVMVYIQRQWDLQDTYNNQLHIDNRQKAHQIQTTQNEIQTIREGMADLGIERVKFNLIVKWLEKVQFNNEDYHIGPLIQFDQLQKQYHDDSSLANTDDQTPILEKHLTELVHNLKQTTTERDNLRYALECKQGELQAVQMIIEGQTTELAQAQQQARDTMNMLEHERELSMAKGTTFMVADLEDKIHVLQRARQLDQQEHDMQLDSAIDDLEKSQKAYKQQSQMVDSLKQTIQSMQQRLDKGQTYPLMKTYNHHQKSEYQLRDYSLQTHGYDNSNDKWIEDKTLLKPLQLRPSSSTPYPISSASQGWSTNHDLSGASDQSDLGSNTCKQNYNNFNKPTATVEMKEQLQQFTEKKVNLMAKILDMETHLRSQRTQLNSETNMMVPDLLAFGCRNNQVERQQKTPIPHSPRKLRSATSQPLISNNHSKHLSAAPPPLASLTAPQSSYHGSLARNEVSTTGDHVTKLHQARSKRTSSSSATTFLSTGTQTSSSTPQSTNWTHTTTSSVSSSSQQSTQTTADQFNKMIHVLQCEAQAAESNIHAHQDVIHKLERQLSRSESSVRDTKKQLEVLHKEKQAYTLEIKNLRSQVTQIMTQQKACLDESSERRKHLEADLEQERRLKEMAEKARVILENRMEVLMAKRNKFMCF